MNRKEMKMHSKLYKLMLKHFENKKKIILDNYDQLVYCGVRLIHTFACAIDWMWTCKRTHTITNKRVEFTNMPVKRVSF